MPGGKRVRGRCRLPGDKSLSHRALLLAALAGGRAELHGLNRGADVRSTASCLERLGARVRWRGASAVVESPGARGLHAPGHSLDCGNSGTTMRLLAGVLAALPFRSSLHGDASLATRPMGRLARPLEEMGATVRGRKGAHGELLPPLEVRGRRLRAVRWHSEVASAQVKSAVLLAAWTARVPAEVTEPARSRDHTERMLRALGERVERVRGGVRLDPRGTLSAPSGRIPGDPSAGAYLAAAAAALPGSDLQMEGVCLNPTRLGFYRALSRMGARVTWEREGTWCGEPLGTLRVRPGVLRGISMSGRSVAQAIDEIPLLCVLGAGACRGVTRVRGAAELRVKEADRIAGLARGLVRLGARVREFPDGMELHGGRLLGGTVDSLGDHRLAMSFRIAALLSRGTVRVRGSASMRISDPGFDRRLRAALNGGRR